MHSFLNSLSHFALVLFFAPFPPFHSVQFCSLLPPLPPSVPLSCVLCGGESNVCVSRSHFLSQHSLNTRKEGDKYFLYLRGRRKTTRESEREREKINKIERKKVPRKDQFRKKCGSSFFLLYFLLCTLSSLPFLLPFYIISTPFCNSLLSSSSPFPRPPSFI